MAPRPGQLWALDGRAFVDLQLPPNVLNRRFRFPSAPDAGPAVLPGFAKSTAGGLLIFDLMISVGVSNPRHSGLLLHLPFT